MKAASEELTTKQEKALVALLDCGEVKEAARVAGVGETTLWRWMQLPEFQARHRGARRQLVETAISQLQSNCTSAVRVLVEVAEDTSAPASSRVSAAKAILEQSISAVELMDMEERIKRLEELNEDGKQTKGFGTNRR